MRIRPLTTADQDLLELFVPPAVFAPDRPLPPAPLAEPAARRWLEPWTTDDVGVVLDAGGDPAGIAIARKVEPTLRTGAALGVPEVLVCVREELRGNGHGGTLLGALTEAASEAGYRELVLTVSPRNSARRLYLRHGFTVVSHTDAGLEVLVSGARPTP